MLQMTSNKNKKYSVNVSINPLPKNCHECPFYYMTNPDEEGGYEEHWDCYLKSITDYNGIALARATGCPLNNKIK